MGFKMVVSGGWEKTKQFLEKCESKDYMRDLERYAQQGVSALQSATPVRTGATAAAWRYEIEDNGSTTSIWWVNDNTTSQGDPIAILLQYGHGTGTGGYVQGQDYINPAMQPVFDQIEEGVWRVMTGA